MLAKFLISKQILQQNILINYGLIQNFKATSISRKRHIAHLVNFLQSRCNLRCADKNINHKRVHLINMWENKGE